MGTKNVGSVVINIDANDADFQKGVDDTEDGLKRLNSSANKMLKSFAKFAIAGVSIAGVGVAFGKLISASLGYNRSMEDSTAKLNAMISASLGYETVTGRTVTAMERIGMVNQETTKTMEKLKAVNAETAMGMKDLIDVYALMKPGMDRTNVAMEDQVEILKLVTNTASNFGLSAEELATGIDDLATGTWISTSGFGKMAKSLGLTQDEVKETTDLVGLLSTKMKETGAAQDTWSVAVSNLGVAWGKMLGKVTQNVWEPLKGMMKDLTVIMGEDGVGAANAFGDAMGWLLKVGIKVAAGIIKAFKAVIAVFDVVASGYNKLAQITNAGALSMAESRMDSLKDQMKAASSAGMLDPSIRKEYNDQIELIKNLTIAKVELGKESKEVSDILNELSSDYDTIDGKVEKYTSSIGKLTSDSKKYSDTLGKKPITPIVDDKAAKKARDKALKDALKAKEKELKAIAKLEEKALNQRDKLIAEHNERFSDAFGGAMMDMLDGDLLGAFNGFFNTISDVMVKPFIDDMSKSLSGMLSNMMGGLGSLGSFASGALISGALLLVKSLFTEDAPISKEDWQKENNIILSPESEAVENLLSSMDWTLTRDLTYSKGIYDNLTALVASSGKAAVALDNMVDFNVADVSETGGFLGYSSKNAETLFAGLHLQVKNGHELYGMVEEIRRTVESKAWGLSTKTTTDIKRDGIFGTPAGDAILRAYMSGFEAIEGGAEALGITGANAIIDGFEGELHSLDFSGKTQEEISAMISGAIGADLDAITEKVAPWIGAFVDAGESYFETMGRIVYQTELADNAFTLLGSGMTVIGEQAAWVSQAFVDASGGMDKALSNVQGFIDGFYTDAEKQALRVDKLSSTGLFGSEELYKAQVEALTTGAAGGDVGAAKQLAELLRLQSDYRDYYDYINTAEQDSLDKRKEAAEEELAFHEDILSRIESAYAGALNYMTNSEKSVALASIAKTKLESGDTQGYFDTLYNQLEYDKSTSATKEDYIPKFESYIAELENADYEKKTLDDVVEKLDELIDATESASYQEPLGTQYYEGARV